MNECLSQVLAFWLQAYRLFVIMTEGAKLLEDLLQVSDFLRNQKTMVKPASFENMLKNQVGSSTTTATTVSHVFNGT